MSSLSFVTPNPLISLHTEQSACLFIRPAVSPPYVTSYDPPAFRFTPLFISPNPLIFPPNPVSDLAGKKKKRHLIRHSPAGNTTDKTVIPQQTQPYPPSCKQTKRLGELTKKQTAKRKAIHKEAQKPNAAWQTFRPFPASERDKRIRESCGKGRTKKEKENKTQRG